MYSSEMHDEATIGTLAEEMLQALREIVSHGASPEAGGRTPSDFPLVRLDQEAVDRLVGDGRAVEDIYPLTPMQAGMVFHSLSQAEQGVYFEQESFVVEGVRDPHLLGRAFQQVVDRTPVLRTRVVWEGVAEPLQVVEREASLPVRHLDWSELSEAERHQELGALLERDRAEGLDLASAPLARLVLARLSDSEVQVVWSFHHVLLDGWSVFQVLSDVFSCHAGLAGDETGRALPARRPFRDYLAWLQAQDARAAEEHWRGVLVGLESPTALPYDRAPLQAHATHSSAWLPLELGEAESARLSEFAKGHRLTLNTVVQGAWSLLLSRYSGQREVCFGTTVSGRPADLAGVDAIAGIFINTVPVRADVDGARDVVGWLQQLQAAQAESRRFDFVSLAQMQTWSDLPGGANLFDSIVVFENYPIGEETIEGAPEVLGVRAVDTTSFPLTLDADIDDQLRFAITYDPDLFDAATIERMAGHLQVLLAGIAAEPDRPLGELPLLSEEERRRVLVEWNDTALDVPAATFPELFEAQVARSPDATALVFGDRALSFAELNAAANRLAHLLIERGAAPERVVALALPRTAEMVVGILAVAKAGGGYLPGDPELPAERIAFVLSDAAAVLVVTTTGAGTVHAALAGGTPCLLVDHPETAAALQRFPDTDPTDAERISPLRPDSSAYVIYTSGSTGRPKGVVVEHRSLVNLLHHHRSGLVAAAGGERLRVALTAAFSFDTSWEGPVLMADGHELHLIDDDVRRDPPALVDYVAEHGIEFLDLTPSYVQQLVSAGLLTDPRHRPKVLMLGGEALGESLWRELAGAAGTTSYNFYGPTECTVDALSARGSDFARPGGGRPLANLAAYVLGDAPRPGPL